MTILTISPCKSTADGEFWELEVVGAAPTTETNLYLHLTCGRGDSTIKVAQYKQREQNLYDFTIN